MSQIELSVAIIFKNEIRCIERCLNSLQPLRRRLSLQIVMADTGSTDGSRAVAKRYADVLFDFPWINDFAAARNAALERCAGDWILVMDCDEWLDGNLDELEKLVRSPTAAKRADGARVVVRSYLTRDAWQYSDLPITRILHRNPELRYRGKIHEYPTLNGEELRVTEAWHTVLHHDGYVMLNDGSEAGRAKLRRNMELLREELREKPEDPRCWLHVLNACAEKPDHMELARRAVALAKAGKPDWERYGAAILAQAARLALNGMLPETLELVRLLRSLFPASYHTRIDAERMELLYHCQRGEYAACIAPGEAYLQGCESLRRESGHPEELSVSPLAWNAPRCVEQGRILFIDACCRLKRFEDALRQMEAADWSVMGAEDLEAAFKCAAKLHMLSSLDLGGVITALWDAIRPVPDASEERLALAKGCVDSGRTAFAAPEPVEGQRPVWQTFLPLRGECVLGDYAAVMAAQTPEEADAALAAIEDLTALPPAVFVHALKTGAAFPLPGRELTVEQSDAMAAMLAEDRPFLREAALFAAEAFETTADLIWARSLALTAFKANDWAADEEPMALLCSFVKVESVFLPLCYAETALREPWLLPPMQRFALHLTSAFAVLFPDAVSPSFPPTGERSVRGALAELKLAAVAAPQQKAAINAFLDTLSTT